jgi:diguanylate cyclase (GGDEF)-like protein
MDDLNEAQTRRGDERDAAAERRDAAGALRDVAHRRLDDASTARDARSARRDELATDRDRAGCDRDVAADARDRDAQAVEVLDASGSATSRVARQEAAADRLHASNDRVAGAEDRARAGSDRGAAVGDRTAAASQHRSAESDRRDAQHDRSDAHDDRLSAAQDLADASIDSLTGVTRRGAGLLALEREIARARRSREALVVAFVDVDDLKAANDRHGHAAGDDLLRGVAEALRRNLRGSDLIFRYGGDEFVCALAASSLPAAEATMLRIDGDLARATPRSSVTAGLAALRPDDTAGTLVGRADAALFRNKRSRPVRRP